MAASFVTLVKEQLFSTTRKKAIKTLACVLGFWGLEKLLESTQYYSCPKEGYTVYAGMFLFGPALCLSTLVLLMSSSFWDAITSCFRGKIDRVAICRTTCHALIKSALLGSMLLILSFGMSDYYVCFRIGDKPKDSSESRKIRRFSSVLAWLLLIVVVLIALLYSAIDRCCFSKSRKSTKIVLRDYERIEAEAAISTFKKEAKVIAKQQGETQIKAILDEVKDGKTTSQVLEKAKKWIIDNYSRSKGERKKSKNCSDARLDEIEALTSAEENSLDSSV